MASAQLFSALPPLYCGAGQFGSLLLTEEILVERVRDFELYPLASHDLGITFDWARIERMRRDAH